MSQTSAETDFAPGLERAFEAAPGEGPIDIEVEGRVPGWLRGSFYMNGPARFQVGDLRYRHWLDGDGMVVRVRFGGTVDGVSRFVQSEKLQAEDVAGRALFRTFGTHFPGDRLVQGMALSSPINVSVAMWDGHLLAFGEQGLPIELDPESLRSIGPFTFDRRLTRISPFSAHAKVDPDDGTLFNFGVSFSERHPTLSYYASAPDGGRATRSRRPLPYAASLHDFAISKRWAAFYLSPYVLDIRRMREEGSSILDCLSFEPERGAWILILDRATGGEVGRWPIEGGYCLHLVNAFDDSDGRLVLDVLELDQPAYPQYRLPDLYLDVAPGRPRRWVVDPKGGPVSSRTVEGPPAPDFPSVLPSQLGRPYRKAWMLGIQAAGQPGRKLFDRLARIDWKAGGVADQWSTAPGWYLAGEPAIAEAGERIGVIVPQWSPNRGTEVLVFDGSDLASGPRAVLRLSRPLHLGFHSMFVPSSGQSSPAGVELTT